MVQKIAITLDERILREIDRSVREGRYPNRSWALQNAAELLLEREKRSRLARELEKLDPAEERALADEDMGDAPWPEY